jgi:hypothetical protein
MKSASRSAQATAACRAALSDSSAGVVSPLRRGLAVPSSPEGAGRGEASGTPILPVLLLALLMVASLTLPVGVTVPGSEAPPSSEQHGGVAAPPAVLEQSVMAG